ncbi:MAG: hypothetical protein ABW003_21950 [Microvirga sp.]
MVDKLKISLEDLTPPECPKCETPMGWYNSQLLEYSPVIIEHRFICSNCGDDIRRRIISAHHHMKVPPSRLSRHNDNVAA